MFLDPIDIPDPLLEAQERGELVVFAGAGVSMDKSENLPDFKGLAEKIAGSHPLKRDICNYGVRMDRFLGDLSRRHVDVQARCRNIIGDSSKPTELHGSLVDLFLKPEHVRIVTTNFDDHFRLPLKRRRLKVDCYHSPALPLGNEFSGIVYLHGTVRRSEPLVLTDEDFGRAYLTEGWAREFLQRLFSKFTTLFVGYSHNDLLVEYLARGMSGKSLAPRFALTAADEEGHWNSLGIQRITFEKVSGPNSFQNLYAGVRKWAEFTKRQPTETAELVKCILCAPEEIAPDKVQSSILRRCLERMDSCHFFSTEAKGWRWVKWLHEQGLLSSIFELSQKELTEPQRKLAFWLAEALVAEASDEGLLLVEKHNGLIGQGLWMALYGELWVNKNVEWRSPMIQKWVIVLTHAAPLDSTSELSNLLSEVAKASPDTVGMAILRRLTALRVIVKRDVDVTPPSKGCDFIEWDDKAMLEVEVAGEFHQLSAVWENCFKPCFSNLRETLIVLLEDRLREAHELYGTAGRTDARIDQREAFRSGRGLNLVLDFLLDVLEESAKAGCSLLDQRLTGWCASKIPVLVRVGLYALHLSTGISKPRKVELIRENELVHPTVAGATHEVRLVLSECYAALDADAKQSLWQDIKVGPSQNRPDDVTEEKWQEWRQDQIGEITWLLATMNRECPEAVQALAELKRSYPDFRGHNEMVQMFAVGGTASNCLRTRVSATDLLSSPPGSQLDRLMSFQGGKGPFEESREGLLHAVADACAQNQAWGVALLEELGSRNEWERDLWYCAFSKMKLEALPQDKLTWLLTSLELHFAESPKLQSLTFFLFETIELSESKRPSDKNLELMIQLSLLIWKQIKGTKAAVTRDFKSVDWANRAINDPAGNIVMFWLWYCDLHRRESGGQISGFPDWLKEPLADMVAGQGQAGQIGRVVLGRHFRFVYEVDPVWAGRELFPKFQFSKVGEEAFLMWEPHARYGALSRELILRMHPIYRDAFPHFHEMVWHLKAGFSRHVAGIVCSCLIDVNDNGWFNEFLIALSEDERAFWAGRVKSDLGSAPEVTKFLLWKNWMKHYWEDRLTGLSCPLHLTEAKEMLEWAFVVGEAFPEAVALILKGPRLNQCLGTVLHILKTHDAPEKHPEAVLNLLDWFFEGSEGCPVSRDVESVLYRVPKKKVYLPQLNAICEHLASLGYRRAVELKQRIKEEFIEE